MFIPTFRNLFLFYLTVIYLTSLKKLKKKKNNHTSGQNLYNLIFQAFYVLLPLSSELRTFCQILTSPVDTWYETEKVYSPLIPAIPVAPQWTAITLVLGS